MFASAQVGLDAALEAYRTLYAPGADAGTAGPEFYAGVSARAFPQAVVFDRTLIDVVHGRSAARVRRDDFDHLTLHYVRSGVMELECGDARLLLGPGEAALVEMTRPFVSRTRGRIVTASLGRDLLRAAGLVAGALHGVAFDGLAGARLGAAVEALPADPADAPAAGERLVAHVRALLRAAPPAPDSRDQARRENARSYIEAHLDVADLSPAEVARATGMSRATLFRAFEPLGGVSAYIQARRLERARLLLATTDLSVAETGRTAGLASASQLTAAFRRRWGITPGAYRRRRTALQDGTVAAAALDDMAVALAETGAIGAPATLPRTGSGRGGATG